MKHINKKLTVISAILLSLIACDGGDQSGHRGEMDAKRLPKYVYEEYLGCYALDNKSKELCLDKLKKKHIRHEFQDNAEYVTRFQYEAERRGFMHFLNDLNKSCSTIIEGSPEVGRNNKL